MGTIGDLFESEADEDDAIFEENPRFRKTVTDNGRVVYLSKAISKIAREGNEEFNMSVFGERASDSQDAAVGNDCVALESDPSLI